jgi:hypothetical protein
MLRSMKRVLCSVVSHQHPLLPLDDQDDAGLDLADARRVRASRRKSARSGIGRLYKSRSRYTFAPTKWRDVRKCSGGDLA